MLLQLTLLLLLQLLNEVSTVGLRRRCQRLRLLQLRLHLSFSLRLSEKASAMQQPMRVLRDCLQLRLLVQRRQS